MTTINPYTNLPNLGVDQFNYLYGNPLNIMQNMLQYQAFERFRTGKVCLDLIILSSITFVGSNINTSVCSNFFRKSVGYCYNRILKLCKKKIIKKLEVSYITDGKEINELFEPIFWYINKLADPNQYDCSRMEITENNKDLFQYSHTSAKFTFNNQVISYNINKHLVTIYADREYTKENIIITLETYIDPKSTILKDFCLIADKEYKKYIKDRENKQSVYRNKEGKWESKAQTQKRSIDTVILRKGYKELIINDLDNFLLSENWYISRDIPYSRKFLFYGSPGTGKSSLIRAIANYTHRNIHYLILSSVKSDEELFTLFESIDLSNTIMVIEDIDSASDITKQRTKEVKGKEVDEKDIEGITLTGLLNAIDGGIVDTHGQILIMTTNHKDKLDEALVRPGRVDLKVEFHCCDEDQGFRLYKNFFSNTVHNQEGIFLSNKKVSPANIVSICIKNRIEPESAWMDVLRVCNGV